MNYKFKTAAGSEYDIFTFEGKQYVSRNGVLPLKNVASGLFMAELEKSEIYFSVPPKVGENFYYWTNTHDGCVSTVVTEVKAYE